MTLRVYNTLSGKKEEFVPINPPKVGMYACGVTVYDYCHIGHARAAVAFDVIARYLRYSGYDVTYVRNYTDIDDKIINRSNEQGIDWKDLAQTFIEAHDTDMGALGVQRADVEPRATDYIAEIIGIVQTLVDRGVGYEVDGDVYFEVEKFDGYGKLSKRNIEEMQSGARIDVDERKIRPLDFALWKSSKPGEPAWDSPWGKGRPGWHIECSAMSAAILGQPLDIHGGGKDLIFPHHENEIAQSEAAAGIPFVRYWMHNGFVNIDSEKMSKSLGNFFTIREVLEKYRPEVVRTFLLSTHYRSPLDFSDKALTEAEVRYERFMNLFARLTRNESGSREVTEAESGALKGLTEETLPAFREAMDDDFNTAAAIGHVFSALGSLNSVLDSADSPGGGISAAFRDGVDGFFREIGAVLGFFGEGIGAGKAWFSATGDDDIRAGAQALAAQRVQARQNKEWTRADELRDEIAELGYAVQDTPQGFVLIPKKDS
ncbi:MAG: cysteine--tRNA ligase [bacterium]|nr:cysteine--tRNA ligase [bacterium]MDT8396788.1 cysteine--tRNA ligase [bacterium]